MGVPQTPSRPHFYPQPLQLQLYQAFIFSIPILFSIILLLLFYLFYLKRRASSQSTLPRSFNQPTSYFPSGGLKGELKVNLPIILFDKELNRRDSQCCVCLGEFEMKEELVQVPSCKHLFHVDCIKHWLHSNSTCPLCRCCVISASKICTPEQPSTATNSDQSPQILEQQQEQQQLQDVREDHMMMPIDGSSSSSTCLGEPNMSGLSNSVDNGMNYTGTESVVIHVR